MKKINNKIVTSFDMEIEDVVYNMAMNDIDDIQESYMVNDFEGDMMSRYNSQVITIDDTMFILDVDTESSMTIVADGSIDTLIVKSLGICTDYTFVHDKGILYLVPIDTTFDEITLVIDLKNITISNRITTYEDRMNIILKK